MSCHPSRGCSIKISSPRNFHVSRGEQNSQQLGQIVTGVPSYFVKLNPGNTSLYSVAVSRRIEIAIASPNLIPSTPSGRNPRTHSDTQVAEFGFVNPILVDTDAGILVGHGRLLGAQKLKLNLPKRQTLWPRPKQYRLQFDGPTLAALADLAERHAEPELLDHLFVYDGSTVLLEFPDAFGPDCPALISADTDEQRIRGFVAVLGLELISRGAGLKGVAPGPPMST